MRSSFILLNILSKLWHKYRESLHHKQTFFWKNVRNLRKNKGNIPKMPLKWEFRSILTLKKGLKKET